MKYLAVLSLAFFIIYQTVFGKPITAFNFKYVTNQKRINTQNLELMTYEISKIRSYLDSIPSEIPVKGNMTSHFGYRSSPFTGERVFHQGMDLAAPLGTPIKAATSGIIMFAGWFSTYGNYIIIAHGNSFVTCYGHLSKYYVIPGQRVVKGEIIGAVGTTGQSTGPHLHYEMWVNGKSINPWL